MNVKCLIVLFSVVLVVRAVGAPDTTIDAVSSELTEKTWLYELTRYLYRWYMDETDVFKAMQNVDDFSVWVCERHPELDEGDHSLYGEVMFPELGIKASAKRADYTVDELGLKISNSTFKVVKVSRYVVPETMPEGCVEVPIDYADMRDYLFRTRKQAQFPDEAMLMHLRKAVREELMEDIEDHEEEIPKETQVVYIAPVEQAANVIYVFWETGRLLIRFQSDADLDNPAFWKHQELIVDMWDVDEQVVVSLDEVAGSNAYLTRDQVGRALFNCIVLGRRLELEPLGQISGAEKKEVL